MKGIEILSFLYEGKIEVAVTAMAQQNEGMSRKGRFARNTLATFMASMLLVLRSMEDGLTQKG